MHMLLTEVTENLARRSMDTWRPAYGSSPANQETRATAVLKRSDKVTPWGEAPMTVVWKASGLLYVATLEHARAAARLMVPPFRLWAPSAEVRAALESAGQILWLLDPKVPSGKQRVARYYTMRLYAARQFEYTFSKLSAGGQLHEYGMPAAAVEAEAAMFELEPVTNKHGLTIGYEKLQMPHIDDLVQEVVGGNGTYSLLSGSTHSEFWSLLSGHRGQEPSPLGVTENQHEAEAESYVPCLSRVCASALQVDRQGVLDLRPPRTCQRSEPGTREGRRGDGSLTPLPL